MFCPQCSAEVVKGARFCSECGSSLGSRCAACGEPHPAGQKFCAECGAPLAAGASTRDSEVVRAGPEMRLVSVLFVDLVSFTTLAEARDAEDIRELLGRYFDGARAIVERYAGTLEKFIGDAVMAVWGVPVAREDDAERAVRAGLEIVDAVTALGAETGLPELQARAGIVTGQAASMDRPGEGLVVGDRVNAASRTQSSAPPGTVYVDGITREATSLAIDYEDAGEHIVKGKSEPLHLWCARRVVAGIGGTQREHGLEAPLIGRDSSLRLLKELFHDALASRAARLVAVTGEAGVGKSRLLWEFDKYADGLAETVLWHTGRCLSYGEGVAYWALAEMLRQRLGLPQDAAAEETQAKLSQALRLWVPEAADREFLYPRLGVLLGVADPELPRAELFAGWRMFFEQLADRHPVVLVFENLQWADEGLLDFIEHLLDWSASSPIFILTLSRAHVAARSAGWPALRRGATLLQLEPLNEEAIGALLDAIVEGLPPAARAQIIERAEGVPLYAVETLRVLVSRGQLVERDGRLALAGELGELDVPASLGSLIAARLDALAPSERRFVKAMAVFGDSFTRAAASELGDVPEERLEEVLAALVRKQVLSISADPLSPDRGQYGFSQGLLRTVAYEMLSRRERKPRHRAAAAYLRSAFPNDGEDVAEVIASHHLDAYRAARGDGDEDELRLEAMSALRRAAQRAATVGAPDTAERAYRSAAELAGAGERPQLQRAAGEMALQAGHIERALVVFELASSAHHEAGRGREAAALQALIGETLHRLERNEEAIERITAALAALGDGESGPHMAALYAVLGKALLFGGQFEQAIDPLDRALALARTNSLADVESRVLNDKGVSAAQSGSTREARELLGAAVRIAERENLAEELILAVGSNATMSAWWDLPGAADEWAEVLALARRRGDRLRESIAAGNLAYNYLFTGRWEEIRSLAERLLGDLEERPGREFLHFPLTMLATLRGETGTAREHLAQIISWERGDDDELRAIHASLLAGLELAEGRPVDALARAQAMLGPAVEVLGVRHDAVRNAWPDALEAALGLNRPKDAAELLELLAGQPPELVPPYLHAQLARGRALLAAAEGDAETVEAALTRALDGFQALGFPYWAARTQTDRAAWLLAQGRAAEIEPLLIEASQVFAELGAEPALARARWLSAGQGALGAPRRSRVT